MKNLELTDEQFRELRSIVQSWIAEGFTTAPYSGEQYDIFEILGLTNKDVRSYDIQRPS
jgi:hypothetical protein